jgi:hypothetical protein
MPWILAGVKLCNAPGVRQLPAPRRRCLHKLSRSRNETTHHTGVLKMNTLKITIATALITLASGVAMAQTPAAPAPVKPATPAVAPAAATAPAEAASTAKHGKKHHGKKHADKAATETKTQ